LPRGWYGSALKESRDVARWVFAIQLALNLAWSFIFFKFRNPAFAFAEIVLLRIAIAVTILKFANVSVVAAWLLVTYLMRVTCAARLTSQYGG
jgi:tryptophan-rich sensory protein